MPARKSGASKTATPASAKSRKRQLSEETPTAAPGSRASKRLKESTGKGGSTGKATPTKSKYFQDSDSEGEDVGDIENDESGYDEDDASAPDEPSSDEPETEDYDSEEDERKKKPRPKKAGKSAGGIIGGVQSAVNVVLEKGKELWRPGVKAGLGPGKQVFIEKPKPRGDGGIKHVPEKIHPHTMAFLKDLKANNDREWLKSTSLGLISRVICHRGFL